MKRKPKSSRFLRLIRIPGRSLIILLSAGVPANQVEGYNQADWILIDYVDFVVHVFSEASRKFYDLERLWRSAKKITPAEFTAKPRRAAPRKQVRKRA